MSEERLYRILDYILNEADRGELDVIRAALRRREEDSNTADTGLGGKRGAMGVDIGAIARETAEAANLQLGASRDQIRRVVRDRVREVIAEKAPELDLTQIDELLDSWVPEPGGEGSPGVAGPAPSPGPPPEALPEALPEAAPAAGTKLPPEALVTMIGQFVAYSTGAMSVSEELQLQQSMRDWHKRYWEHFPSVVRKLITLFLKGAMGGDDFWRGIYDELGLDPE